MYALCFIDGIGLAAFESKIYDMNLFFGETLSSTVLALSIYIAGTICCEFWFSNERACAGSVCLPTYAVMTTHECLNRTHRLRTHLSDIYLENHCRCGRLSATASTDAATVA